MFDGLSIENPEAPVVALKATFSLVAEGFFFDVQLKISGGGRIESIN